MLQSFEFQKFVCLFAVVVVVVVLFFLDERSNKRFCICLLGNVNRQTSPLLTQQVFFQFKL